MNPMLPNQLLSALADLDTQSLRRRRRVLDGVQGSRAFGRMVISGRMADVCAELDRLAAIEGPGS